MLGSNYKIICSSASVLVSGAYDRTVALWDVKGLYRTLVLKVTALFDLSEKNDIKCTSSSNMDSLHDHTCYFL